MIKISSYTDNLQTPRGAAEVGAGRVEPMSRSTRVLRACVDMLAGVLTGHFTWLKLSFHPKSCCRHLCSNRDILVYYYMLNLDFLTGKLNLGADCPQLSPTASLSSPQALHRLPNARRCIPAHQPSASINAVDGCMFGLVPGEVSQPAGRRSSCLTVALQQSWAN